jgi:tetratricopeptide (TPR) repeat protein
MLYSAKLNSLLQRAARRLVPPRAWIPGIGGTMLAVLAAATWWFVGFDGDIRKPAGTALAATQPADLAEITPPNFDASASDSLEGEAGNAFREAMVDYAKGSWPRASVMLKEASSKSPSAAEPRFFLGISYLMTRDTQAGLRELRVAGELGQSRYVQAAHYFSGKALIKLNDLVHAAEELQKAAQLPGSYSEPAARLRALVVIRQSDH